LNLEMRASGCNVGELPRDEINPHLKGRALDAAVEPIRRTRFTCRSLTVAGLE
jgi:hypothetical protein